MFYSLSICNRPKGGLVKLSPLLTCLEKLTVSVRSADRLEGWGGCGIPILSIKALAYLLRFPFSLPTGQASVSLISSCLKSSSRFHPGYFLSWSFSSQAFYRRESISFMYWEFFPSLYHRKSTSVPHWTNNLL